MSGAVDLSGLKERAQARRQPPAEGADGSGSATAVAVTEANFEDEVLRRSLQVPVVVVLGSPRSRVSAEMAQTLAGLAAADGGSWVLADVDVEANMRIAQAFGVQAVPTVIAVAGGRPLADYPGGPGEAELRQWVDALLKAVEGKLAGPAAAESDEPEAEDPRFTVAEQALDNGDFAAAEAAYAEILAAEPANADAQAAIRQVRFLSRATLVSPDATAAADADPANLEAAFAAADAELLAQRPDAAFDRLIALVKATSGDERTSVRTRLLELFELFDPAEPVIVAARRKLATALY
ncbi:MAG: tetratricopeptide repeat protein [Mycobacteriaceae bacterium]|nr:tetratricopeptide repeat protein [Mycobacteriaceae bacterium]